MKKEIELEEKVKLLEKEITVLGEASDNAKLDMEEAVDKLRIEIESLKAILNDLVPDFQNKYQVVKNSVLREIDPQWIEKK